MKYKKYEFMFDKSEYDIGGISIVKTLSKIEQNLRLYTLQYLQYLRLISICRIKDDYVAISDLPSNCIENDKKFDNIYHEFAIINKNFDYIPLGVLKTNKVYLEQISNYDLDLNINTLYKLTIGRSSSGLLTFTKYEDACKYINENKLDDMFVIAIPYKNIRNTLLDMRFNFKKTDVVLSSINLNNISKYKDNDTYVISHNDLAALNLNKDEKFDFIKTFRNLSIYKYIGEKDVPVDDETINEIEVVKTDEEKPKSHIINKCYPIIDGEVKFGDKSIELSALKTNLFNNGYKEDKITKYKEKCLPMIVINLLDDYISGDIESAYVSDDCDIVILVFKQRNSNKRDKTINKYLVLMDKNTINNFKIKNRNRNKVESVNYKFKNNQSGVSALGY